MLEGFRLQPCITSDKFLVRNGQLRPLVKDSMSFRTRPSLELGFDLPREVWTIVLAKDGVGNSGICVLRVDQKSINVEDARTDPWEAVR